ncbi:MAG TPA: hypothetical protein VGD81_09955 [Opitutaceae bacterium]
MPALNTAHLGHRRNFPAVTARVRASLVLRRLALAGAHAPAPGPGDQAVHFRAARNPADDRHAA